MKPNTPQITNKIDGFTFTWGDKSLTINVNRLDVHKDGRVTGELLITQGKAILMPATQFNFSADRTRSGLVKNLAEKYKDIDWATVIDQLSHHVQELAKAGEPVEELWTSNEYIKPEYMLHPILFKKLPTVIFGEKGVRKSGLTIILAACLLLPWHDNPFGFTVPEKSVRTLILDWETEKEIALYEAQRIKRGMDLPDFPILYRRCHLPLADDLEQIQKHIEQQKAEVVIIDSLGAAAGGELNRPEIALNFFAALRKLKTTPLIIAQTSKSDEGKKSIFGSTYFTYYARSIFELCRGEEAGDEMHVALFHKWCNLDKTQPPIGLCFHFNDKGLSVVSEPVSYSQFKDKLNRYSQVKDYLMDGVKSTAEIMEALEITRGNADMIMKRMKEKGMVVKVDNKWGLLSKEVI